MIKEMASAYFFPHVGHGSGYVTFGMMKMCNVSPNFNSLLYSIETLQSNDVSKVCLGMPITSHGNKHVYASYSSS